MEASPQSGSKVRAVLKSTLTLTLFKTAVTVTLGEAIGLGWGTCLRNGEL